MLTVYKKYLGYLFAGETVILALAAALIHDGIGWPAIVAVAVVLSLILLVVLELRAAMLHQRLLSILYHQQQPKDFIQVFFPLSQQRRVRPNAMLTVMAYLSNAYAAQGDFNKALEILDAAPTLRGRRGDEARALLAGNRCSIYLYMGDVARGEKELAELSALVSSGKAARQQETLELLRTQLATLQGKATQKDADLVRNKISGKGSSLHNTQLSYQLGLIYSQLGEKAFARHYLEEAAKAGKEIWVSRQAAQRLKASVKK